MLTNEKIEAIATEIAAPISRYFPYWRDTLNLCRAIEQAVRVEMQQFPVAMTWEGVPIYAAEKDGQNEQR